MPVDYLLGRPCVAAGRRTVNTEPLPGSLVTVTSPPIRRASLREMARPSPVPPNRAPLRHRLGEFLEELRLCSRLRGLWTRVDVSNRAGR